MAVDTADISDPKAKEAIDSGTAEFIPQSSQLSTTIDDFFARHSSSPQHILGAVRARALVDRNSKSRNQDDVFLVLKCNNPTLDDAVDALRLLKDIQADEETCRRFKTEARQLWKEATAFDE